jgi:hypothetical protein
MMNTRIIGAAIGALLLGGTTLANAGGLDDLFRLLPHPEVRADHRDDHRQEMAWHRDDRGFTRHEEYQRAPDEDRFEAHRDDRGFARHEEYRRAPDENRLEAHRDDQGFARHEGYQREPDENRFEAHRDDQPRFAWHDHDRR